MLSIIAAIVALSLAAGGGSAGGSAPAPAGGSPGATLSNAQRAKLGLLPRKAPKKKTSAVKQKGRRVIHAVHQPTFLGEPTGPEEEPAYAEVEAIPTAEVLPAVVAPREVRDVRLAASSVVTDVTIVLRYAQ